MFIKYFHFILTLLFSQTISLASGPEFKQIENYDLSNAESLKSAKLEFSKTLSSQPILDDADNYSPDVSYDVKDSNSDYYKTRINDWFKNVTQESLTGDTLHGLKYNWIGNQILYKYKYNLNNLDPLSSMNAISDHPECHDPLRAFRYLLAQYISIRTIQ